MGPFNSDFIEPRKMKAPWIDKFSDMLDDIFKQGDPTKAQIIDAYNKCSSQNPYKICMSSDDYYNRPKLFERK